MNVISEPVSLGLCRHPAPPCGAKLRAGALVGTAPGDLLHVVFTLHGDISALRIPEPGPPRRADGLWRHTCFEVFAMGEEGPGYLEFNFSPSGEWAVYVFGGYRERREPGAALTRGISVRRTESRLDMYGEIGQDLLPPGGRLRLGLSAVVEEADGLRSYWALRHPPGKPDFHHIDAFALQLGRPGMPELDTPAVGAPR